MENMNSEILKRKFQNDLIKTLERLNKIIYVCNERMLL